MLCKKIYMAIEKKEKRLKGRMGRESNPGRGGESDGDPPAEP